MSPDTFSSISKVLPGNQRCSGMLNLHFMEENIAVLGDLDVPGSPHQHLHGALRPKVGLQYILR